MRTFDYKKIAEYSWDNEVLSYVAKIHECKGRQELYLKQRPAELERLVEIAKIQSTESSNRIEGIITTNARLKQLVEDKTTPRNRDEMEILGYRNVLNLIHENYAYIPVEPGYILQLHRDLLKYTNLTYRGHFKTTPNEIDMTLPSGERHVLFRPLEPYETPGAVEALCCTYQDVLRRELVDPLLLIPCFILDFLCIHPFNDGNGRMSRLLTLLMLYQNGYVVGQYISIEKAIAETKDEYYAALAQADQHWHEEENDPTPFIKYMLAVICSCYQDFEQRVDLVGGEQKRVTAYERVRSYAMEKLGAFTKQEAAEACPGFGTSSIESALKKLTEEGVLERIGAGRKTQYVRR
jgi:Fic family protein